MSSHVVASAGDAAEAAEGDRWPAVVTCDATGRILSWDDRATAVYGWTAAEAVGRPAAELLVPAGAPPETWAVLAGERQGVVDVRDRSGRTFPAYVRGHVLMTEPVAVVLLSAPVDGADTGPSLVLVERMRSAERAAVDLFRLQRVTSALARTLSAADVARCVLDEGRRALSAGGGALVADGAVPLATVGEIGGETAELLATIARTGELVWAESPDGVALGPGVGAAAVMPLTVDGRVIGALGFCFTEPREFAAADRDFLLALAGQAAQALERARLYDAAHAALSQSERERTRAQITANRLGRLQNVATRLSTARTVDEVVTVVLSQSIADQGASTAAIALLDEEGTALRLVRSIGLREGVAARYERIPLDTVLPVTEALRTGEPIYLPSQVERDRDWPALVGVDSDSRAFAVVPLTVEDRRIGVIALGFPTEREFDEPKRRFLAALADQCALALERAWLDEAERRAGEQLAFLARAGSELAATLDLDATLGRVLDLAVGTLGDLAVLYLYDDPRTVRRAGARYADARLAAAVPEGDLVPGSAIAQVLQTGETIVAGGTVTLALRGRHHAVFGALMLGRGPDRPAYAPADLAFAEEFVARAAVAVENARLFAQRSDVAHTLQRSLLPPRLPEIDGIAVAARFRPTYEDLLVGGDFYDLFRLGDRWAVLIGDVVGTGARAATTTALVRHTVRAVAPLLGGPAEVVAAINAALAEWEGDEAFCTLIYGELEPGPDGVRVTLVGAGHPPPYVLRADGSVTALELGGTLLGPLDEIRAEAHSLLLAPGELLVCYTDGVVEARAHSPIWARPPFFGEDGLRALLRDLPRTADAVADGIDRAVLEFTSGIPSDDVAVLVVQAASR